MTQAEVIQKINEKYAELETWTAVAKKMGVSVPYIRDVVNGKRGLGPKVLKYFGLQPEVLFVPSPKSKRDKVK